MKNIATFFDRVYVINLERRADRLHELQTNLSLSNIPWDVVREQAVDGAKEKIPQWYPKNVGKGAYGCYMSHLHIIEKAKQDNLKNVLILEDDCMFFPDSVQIIQEAINELPDDWHFLYLGTEYHHRYVDKYYKTICPWPIRISPHIVRCHNANRTHAYALNSTAFDMVLNHLNRHSFDGRVAHIDHQYGILHEKPEVNCYVTYPNACAQSGSVSNIAGQKTSLKRWSIKMPYIKPSENNGVLVSEFKVGYGLVGIGGELGYENKRVSISGLTGEYEALSVHAPSDGVIECTNPIEIFAAQNGDDNAHSNCTAYIDDKEIGSFREKNSRTDTVVLEPGQHKLVIKTGKNWCAHSVWCFRKIERNGTTEPEQVNINESDNPSDENEAVQEEESIAEIHTGDEC